MKKIIFINGTMGAGKTTVSQALKNKLYACVFLDGDWCWDMHPFIVNDTTKNMVLENISYQINNFIKSHQFEYIIFCWVMHEEEIAFNILNKIQIEECEILRFTLMLSEETLRTQLQQDIIHGSRDEAIIKRAVERLPLYEKQSTIKIHCDGKSIDNIVEEILQIVTKR